MKLDARKVFLIHCAVVTRGPTRIVLPDTLAVLERQARVMRAKLSDSSRRSQMPRYEATIKLTVSCSDDNAARKAKIELEKFLESSIVKATLIGRGITPMTPAEVDFKKPTK